MKKTSVALFAFLFILSLGAGAAYSLEAGPGGSAQGSASLDKDHLEGWIIGVNYQKSYFRLLDPRGFQRQVTTKPGTIGDYRLGDKVRVEIDPDYKRASSIEKIR